MLESDLDGDQDLTLWLRSLEDVLRELLGDDIHITRYVQCPLALMMYSHGIRRDLAAFKFT